MFDKNDVVFNKQQINIPQSSQIVFVSDMFVDDYVGGAELTSEALIKSSPYEIFKLRTKDLTLDVLQQGINKFWIFGNFAEINPQLIPSIIGNLKYSVLEYDYKYCKLRSPEKHRQAFGTPCDCHDQMNGKIVSAFFYGASHIWWMSEKQKERYENVFPFLNERTNTVLSSVFDDKTLAFIKLLRAESVNHERKGWIVLGSNSWIKGVDDAKQWCEENGKEYEVVWNMPYEQLLEKMSRSEGFVYLPRGGDTCPRMVIEAKLLGCKLHLNEFVEHKNEEWFNVDEPELIEQYLYAAKNVFWHGIKDSINYQPRISGYTTTYNCLLQQYPFKQCISSMLNFCEEVCVVDGGSTDGTWEALLNLKAALEVEGGKQLSDRLKLKKVERDWNSKYHPVFDGMQKAEARKMCTLDFCWQMDSDEIVHETDAARILAICKALPMGSDVLSLPVIEYWGGPEKVRLDIQPWKWRLSRNKPYITHGIPKQLRRYDENTGELYAAEGTDGCDMIDEESGEPLPHVSFYNADVEKVRQAAQHGNESARLNYEKWFNSAVTNLPCVFHYSWYDLTRKIKLYRDYWQNHWLGLYNKDTSDTAENNMMFDLPWSQITDEMIEKRALEMKEKLGGWIWHTKWDGETRTNHIRCDRSQPSIMTNSETRHFTTVE